MIKINLTESKGFSFLPYNARRWLSLIKSNFFHIRLGSQHLCVASFFQVKGAHLPSISPSEELQVSVLTSSNRNCKSVLWLTVVIFKENGLSYPGKIWSWFNTDVILGSRNVEFDSLTCTLRSPAFWWTQQYPSRGWNSWWLFVRGSST